MTLVMSSNIVDPDNILCFRAGIKCVMQRSPAKLFVPDLEIEGHKFLQKSWKSIYPNGALLFLPKFLLGCVKKS